MFVFANQDFIVQIPQTCVFHALTTIFVTEQTTHSMLVQQMLSPMQQHMFNIVCVT
jgi:hypothetical protein